MVKAGRKVGRKAGRQRVRQEGRQVGRQARFDAGTAMSNHNRQCRLEGSVYSDLIW